MPLTHIQREAVAARGNVIVVAGAGTGKTSTLVNRCLDVIRDRSLSSLDRVLMVTFTEAAAAEMRHRLRVGLQELADAESEPSGHEWLAEQLALVETARISTIHSFCLRLVQAHFHQLGLDPEVRVLDDQQCRLLMLQTLDGLMEECYDGTSPLSDPVRSLIAAYAPDRDSIVRELVLKLHNYTQSLSGAARWVQEQQASWERPFPAEWEDWLVTAFNEWRREWLPVITIHKGVKNIDACLAVLDGVPGKVAMPTIKDIAETIVAAGNADWQRLKTKVHKPLAKFFDEAAFLTSVADDKSMRDDWHSVRGHMGALLSLSAEFTGRFTHAKREMGGVDFPDLEQLTLRLLWNDEGKPSAVAMQWQERMHYVFVDECQDINDAQDAILTAVSRSGTDANRFLVGDVKQSIYQFRLADPQIFRHYESEWSNAAASHRLALMDNFRSRPGILEFVNTLFDGVMRAGFGGVAYEPLQAGEGSCMADLGKGPCVELHLIRKASVPEAGPSQESDRDLSDLSAIEREARLVALRMRELKDSGFRIWDKEKKEERSVEWDDMAVLLRSPGPRTEVYAKVFHQAGIPLAATRGGFLDASEVSDLVSLLQLLDNPLQDIPLLAVLRSPLVGLNLDQLALVRARCGAKPFWRALQEYGRRQDGVAAERIATFLKQVEHWRHLVRQVGPSPCLEEVLSDTNYDLLIGANERGMEQLANVHQLLNLARQFDPYLRQGLFRFLKFLRALEESGDSLAPAPAPARNAVQLMSIHKSKGLEFPVVALAGLGSRFNLQELNGLMLLDSVFGLAPKAITGSGKGRYPTLPFWLAERRQRAQCLGEELRLMYVATTRARDRLICTGTLSRKDQGRWEAQPESAVSNHELLSARSPMDWLMSWLPTVTSESQWRDDDRGASSAMTWELWDPQDERLRMPGDVTTAEAPMSSEIPVEPGAVKALTEQLSWVYGHRPATTEPAKSSVSALRRRASELVDEEAVHRFPGARERASRGGRGGKLTAAERGTLHHRFLEHVLIQTAHSADALAEQAQGLVQQGVFSEAEISVLDLTRMAAFWSSDIGRMIRDQSINVRRELPFSARFQDAEVRAVLGQALDGIAASEFVVIQGVADLVVILEGEIWLLDYKTDDVDGEALRTRAGDYVAQLRLYSAALERIHGKPVRHRWLHFLLAGETVEVSER